MELTWPEECWIKFCRQLIRGRVLDWGGGERCLQVLVGRPVGKRPLGRPRRRWEDNIKMDLRETVIDVANWIRLVHHRVQWRAFVNTVMKLRIP
jgi:hypothetical protein